VHEIKFDGYRTQAHLHNGQPAIYTRRAYDWTLRLRSIADALAALPAKDLILDGEAFVFPSARAIGRTESERTPWAPWIRTPSISAVADGPLRDREHRPAGAVGTCAASSARHHHAGKP
jgi:ATP dependent DNA ligase domain